MTRKPRLFLLVSLALLAVLLSFPLQVVYLYSHTFTELSSVIDKISLLNLICMIAVAISSYQAYQASPLLRWTAPITLSLICWNNLIVGNYATDFSMSTTTMATMGFALMFTPLLTPTARYVLSNEKHRWWLRPARYKKRVSTTLNPFVGTTIHAHTFDISTSGAFIHLDQEEQGQAPRVGESIRLSMNIGGMRNVRCEAVIVRVTEPKGSYPTGLGLQFKSMDRMTQKDLARFLASNSTIDC